MKNTNRWIQSFAVISLVVCSIALLLTFGRVAILLWILLVAAVFIIVLFKKIKTISNRMLLVCLSIIFVVIIGSFPVPHEVFLRFSQTSLFEESVTERTELLSASIRMIQHHPLLGVGLDNFIPALAPLQKPMPLGLYLQPVHNIFVLVAAETGIIGFGLFIWLLAGTIQRIKKQELSIGIVSLVLLIVILVTGSFDHYWLTLQQGQLLFATIIGLNWTSIKRNA